MGDKLAPLPDLKKMSVSELLTLLDQLISNSDTGEHQGHAESDPQAAERWMQARAIRMKLEEHFVVYKQVTEMPPVEGPKVVKAVMPNCCGNCRWNDWGEMGPVCINPWRKDSNRFWLDEDVPLDEVTVENVRADFDDNGDGEPDWDEVCGLHDRQSDGKPMRVTRKEVDAAQEARIAAELPRLIEEAKSAQSNGSA